MTRIVTCVVALAVVAVGATKAEAQAKGNQAPNVIVFLADDLGYGDLGCYGHPVMKTPHLDKFAKQGMRFTQCYAACPVCSPSRSAILTGRTPYRNGVFTWIPENSDVHLRSSEITLATLLRRAGYATCHVGKWHLNGKFNSPDQPQPNDHGYDWWLATQNNAGPSHKDPKNFVRNGKAVGPMEGYSSSLVVDEAIRWLKKERDPAKPFFMTVWTHEPHLPIESDPKFMGLYADLVKSDPDKAQHHGNISQMDHAFGVLMQALDTLKLADNTIVIFTSDNGPEGNGLKGRSRGSTGGLRGRKRSVYAGGIQVPGIVRWPGKIKGGAASDQPIIGSDIFTTVCAITKVPVPKDRPIDGANISPAFEGKSIDRQTPMYWRYHGAPEPMKIAMRDGDWKILSNVELSQFELYNLKADPRETSDVKTKEPERFEALRKTLLKLNAEIEKEGPTWWKGYEEKQPKKKTGKAVVWDFEDATDGKLPSGWTAAQTGKGTGSVWQVLIDKTAPRGPKVLAQTAVSPSAMFNLCIADKTSYKDVEMSVAFKAVKGETDQGGGVLWRYQDANNYYVARLNPLEENYRLYKIVKGQRIQLASKEGLNVATAAWHTLTVKHVGERIECFLDGKKVLDATDSAFAQAGKIGLWTKADAQTYFDALQVTALKE